MLTPEADLRRRLKLERCQRKAREPFKPSLFVRIHAMVQQYGLGEDFLKKLDDFADNFPWAQLSPQGARVKEDLQLPLFALATPEKYRLTMAIIEKVDNPYIYFANSPEEILLSTPLFKRHPHLEPERLAAHHFQTLLSTDPAGDKPETSERA
jgi:hypothetical protein